MSLPWMASVDVLATDDGTHLCPVPDSKENVLLFSPPSVCLSVFVCLSHSIESPFPLSHAFSVISLPLSLSHSVCLLSPPLPLLAERSFMNTGRQSGETGLVGAGLYSGTVMLGQAVSLYCRVASFLDGLSYVGK